MFSEMPQLESYLSKRKTPQSYFHSKNCFHIFLHAATFGWKRGALSKYIFIKMTDNTKPHRASESRRLPTRRVYFSDNISKVALQPWVVVIRDILQVPVHARWKCTWQQSRLHTVHSCIPALNASLQVNKCWIYWHRKLRAALRSKKKEGPKCNMCSTRPV